MNSPDDLEAAFALLKSEARRLAFGKLTITAQVHEGKLSKVYRTTEETVRFPSEKNGRQPNENSK